MASRIAVRYISRRLSSSGKILSEEEKAVENVYIKKMEQEKLEKAACKDIDLTYERLDQAFPAPEGDEVAGPALEPSEYVTSKQLKIHKVVKVSDPSGEVWLSTFNEEAEHIIGCSADELNQLKSQENEENPYQLKLKQATWVPHLFRVSVAQHEYMSKKDNSERSCSC